MTEVSLIGTHNIMLKEELSVLASRLSSQLQPGDIVLLSGDLGAGKTAFTQLLGKALGVREVITSPTYTLLGEYDVTDNQSISKFIHIDLYRTGDVSAPRASVLNNTYLGEVIEGAERSGAIVVIEWGELLETPITNNTWRISLQVGEKGEERIVTIEK